MLIKPLTTIPKLVIATIVCLSLWLVWIGSLSLAALNHQSSYADLQGEPIGADFIQFYSAGLSILQDQSSNLYDREFQHSLQSKVFNGELSGGFYFNTPPWVALFFSPFALLPFIISFLIWISFQLLALIKTISILKLERRNLPYIFGFFPIFAAFSYGQSGIILLLIFTLVYNAIKNQNIFTAGMIASLLCYKPQFLTGLLLWWLICPDKRKALLGFTIGAIITLFGTYLLCPQAMIKYVEHIHLKLVDLDQLPDFPFTKFQTTASFFKLLIPYKIIAQFFTTGITLLGLVFFCKLIRNRFVSNEIKFSTAVIFTVLLSPYTLVYDLSILVLPATLLYENLQIDRQKLRMIFSFTWISILLGVTILNPFQADHFTHWFNVSEFAVLFCSIYLLKEVSSIKPALNI